MRTTTICGARKYDGSSFVKPIYGIVDIGSTTIDHGGKIKDRVKLKDAAYAYVRHGVFKDTKNDVYGKKERIRDRLRALDKEKRVGTK